MAGREGRDPDGGAAGGEEQPAGRRGGRPLPGAGLHPQVLAHDAAPCGPGHAAVPGHLPDGAPRVPPDPVCELAPGLALATFPLLLRQRQVRQGLRERSSKNPASPGATRSKSAGWCLLL